eukprot:TRINITY_DN73703_c0_g1_i1.p1 TRINITY_DN73703_c0_g1~~TRINITY_DN73703_c0_g1_i1.p1  ORF type:complete len:344 (-),score=87.55 TRINITY_DN73703_c0_g1_i1:57-1055(-)
MPESHLLSAAQRVWSEVCADLKPADEVLDEQLLAAEDLKKVVKWLQHSITKFGASASVADEATREQALKPIAEEVIKAFTAGAGTLLSMRRGAGSCLVKELKDNGAGLAEAIDALGAAVGHPTMSICAGKALERAKYLEKTSINNRAAIRRRLLKCISQLRDANREMKEDLLRETPAGGSKNEPGGSGGYGDGDEDDDLEESDDMLEVALSPAERRILEAVHQAALLSEDVLKEASTSCMPAAAVSGAGPTILELEEVGAQAESVASAIDALATDSVGGMDVEACKQSILKLSQAFAVFAAHFQNSVPADQLQAALAALQEALEAAEAEDVS